MRPFFSRLEKYNNFNTLPKTGKKLKKKSIDFSLSHRTDFNVLKFNYDNKKDELFCVEIDRPFFKFRSSTPEKKLKNCVKESSNKSKYSDHSTKLFSMPLVESFHQELQTMPSQTLAELICGDYNIDGGSFIIIDCRFPYEYNGGHIIGAINLNTKNECTNSLFKNCKKNNEKNATTTLILYSEYSTRRSLNL